MANKGIHAIDSGLKSDEITPLHIFRGDPEAVKDFALAENTRSLYKTSMAISIFGHEAFTIKVGSEALMSPTMDMACNVLLVTTWQRLKRASKRAMDDRYNWEQKSHEAVEGM